MKKFYALLIVALLSASTFAIFGEYNYGDHFTSWKLNFASGGTELQISTGVADAAACETLCENYSGTNAPCNIWNFKSSTGRCVLGKDAPIKSATSVWTTGFNTPECEDEVLNCTQNTVCDSWTNETFSVSGGKRILTTTDGEDRCYYVYVPDSCKDNESSKCKVVFNFGGVSKNAIPWATDRINFTERITGESSLSGTWSTPAIVVYPQRYATAGGWNFHPGRSSLCDVDDIQYVEDILDNLTDNDVYWDKIYAAGQGSGGHFVFDLPKHMEDLGKDITAIAAYSGNSLTDHGGTVDYPSSSAPLSVLIAQGYDDATHGYWGHTTTGCDIGKVDSRTMADAWGTALGCSGHTVDECNSGTAPNCTGTEGEKHRYYNSCPTDVTVELYSINAGHSWPTPADQYFTDFFDSH